MTTSNTEPKGKDRLAASLDLSPADDSLQSRAAQRVEGIQDMLDCLHTQGGLMSAVGAIEKFQNEVLETCCRAESLARLNAMRDVIARADFPPGVPRHDIPMSLQAAMPNQGVAVCWDIGEGWAFSAPSGAEPRVTWLKVGPSRTVAYMLTAGGAKTHQVSTPDIPFGVDPVEEGWPVIQDHKAVQP